MSDFGPTIRHLRTKKGYQLSKLAKEIGVSTGYLSNLETGKTTTITLETMEKLNEKLDLFPSNPPVVSRNSLFTHRTESALSKLTTLEETDKAAANYLLRCLEEGIDIFEDKQS
ncbi:helix-turn-helix domain-containing protein [Thalassorhabdus alkalitolerans]|uniref:Helix-turn-helix domain-containing protein n=1 Tax=Thalassorhabdus alkalitolerans TaxID=2282697 RepID=A0ABW0YQM7_9BACI